MAIYVNAKKYIMEGFFSKKETESVSRPDGKKYSCIACGLYKDCKNPKTKPFGNFKKGILNIGEAPGEREDTIGRPWQGKSGKLLQRTYKELGIDLFEDCLNINAVRCRVLDTDGDDRTPTNYEVECCRKTILAVIQEYKPKVIILLGNSAVYSLIAHRWKKDFGNLNKWRGWIIPDQDFEAWLCPTFHPDEVEKDSKNNVTKIIWKQDLQEAVYKLQQPFPKYIEPEIEMIEDLSVLDDIKFPVAIDYETTGIKPHADGHKIICASVATSANHAFVFLMPKSRKARLPFVNLLANPKIPKIAQNMKFEEAWSIEILRQPVINWNWDTMLASHILDNRPGVTGLKFQTYVQFGIVDYSSEIEVYLKSGNKNEFGSNAINNIEALLNTPDGKGILMKYCALDTIFTYRLCKLQQSLIIDDLPF